MELVAASPLSHEGPVRRDYVTPSQILVTARVAHAIGGARPNASHLGAGDYSRHAHRVEIASVVAVFTRLLMIAAGSFLLVLWLVVPDPPVREDNGAGCTHDCWISATCCMNSQPGETAVEAAFAPGGAGRARTPASLS